MCNRPTALINGDAPGAKEPMMTKAIRTSHIPRITSGLNTEAAVGDFEFVETISKYIAAPANLTGDYGVPGVLHTLLFNKLLGSNGKKGKD